MNMPLLMDVTVMHLDCMLHGEEQACLEMLTRIQMSRQRDGLSPHMRAGLAERERELLVELNQLKRARVATPPGLLVTLVNGGVA